MRLNPTRLNIALLLLSAALCLIFFAAAWNPIRPSDPRASGPAARTPTGSAETYGRIPLSFEANQGQIESGVDFVARGAGYTLFLKSTEVVFALNRSQSGTPTTPATLRMNLVGAKESAAEPADELPGKINYLVGDDPATGEPTCQPSGGCVIATSIRAWT